MQIYTHHNLNDLPWPAASESVKAMLSALVHEGTRPFISNVDAEVQLLLAGNTVLPLVLVDNPPVRPNAYVCSPTTHYVDYAKREVELELADQPLLRKVLPPLLETLRPLLRWSQAERIVYVNNWLLSTNLYPTLDNETLRAIQRRLLATFPDHTIIFRSLNEGLNNTLITQLEQLGFQRNFSRQVYLLDPRDGAFRRRNNYGNDRRLARRTPYRWLAASEIPLAASNRLCDLYSDLYLRKYSQYNPQFTPHYVAEALRGEWLAISALALGDSIDGVLGFIEQHNVMTAPLVGYDSSPDANAGLYRLLMLALSEQAAERGCMLHLSSGAAAFKRLRGGEPFVEYSLVYHQHLPPRRRLPWQLLAWLSRRAIIPLMQRFGL